MVPGARIELARPLGSRDFKSLASTYSATQAHVISVGYKIESNFVTINIF